MQKNNACNNSTSIWRSSNLIEAETRNRVSVFSHPIPREFPVGFFFLLLFVLVSAPRPVFAAESSTASKVMISADTIDTTKPFGERKTLHGNIGAMNKEGIAFVYKKSGSSETEMWLPFNDSVRFSGYSDKSSIAQGDEAVVTYEEDKEGKIRVLREINFVSKPQSAAEQPETESDAEPESPDAEAAQ